VNVLNTLVLSSINLHACLLSMRIYVAFVLCLVDKTRIVEFTPATRVSSTFSNAEAGARWDNVRQGGAWKGGPQWSKAR